MRKDWIDAGDKVGALDVIEIHAACIGDDVDGTAGLLGDDGVELPAGTENVRKRMNVRHSVIENGGPTVARVECGWTLFRAEIGGILREGGVGEIKIDTVGSAVEGLGVGVRGEAREAVEILESQRGLQTVVRGVGAAGEDIDCRILRESGIADGEIAALVGVIKARKASAFAADIADFERDGAIEFALKIQVPALNVWSAEAEIGDEDGLRKNCGSEDGSGGGTVPCGGIKILRADEIRTASKGIDGIGGDTSGIGVVGDDVVLRSVVVIDSVGGTDYGTAAWTPGNTEAWTEIVEIAVIDKRQSG